MSHTPLASWLDLSHKTALVTGAAAGIGLAIAQRLAEAGAQVILSDVNAEAVQAAAQHITESGGRAEAAAADVSSPEDVARIVEAAERHGGVDILVNNAGIYPNHPLLQLSPEDFDKVIAVNLKGVFLTTKAVSAQMISRQKAGKIINITSIDALHPSMAGLSAYDASKHGVWGFTKNVALELAPHGITVNAVAPGGVLTPGVTGNAEGQMSDELKQQMAGFISAIPLKRMGDPDEIAKAVVFLASDMSSYMTGSQVVVDGGRLLG